MKHKHTKEPPHLPSKPQIPGGEHKFPIHKREKPPTPDHANKKGGTDLGELGKKWHEHFTGRD